MSKCFAFFTGLITGAYIAQTYKIPKVNTMIKEFFIKISEYELKNDNSSDKTTSE